MILIIDNYDSFVFNLARYVEELGEQAIVRRNDQLTLDDISAIDPSHIILSPGPCTPSEAGICISLIQRFLTTVPILGVCLGHQAIAQALGAKVVRSAYPMHGKATLVEHNAKGLFGGIITPLQVARYHSLIVEKNSIPDSLQVTACSVEGEVMALQHTTYPVFGVQFHPESVLTELGHQLLEQFLRSHRYENAA